MNDKMRWRHGDTNPVIAAVDSATVIEIGDLVYQDVDDAKPASSQADQGSETANQELLADNFLGVAMQRSRSGDTDPIRVSTTGVFEFDCPVGTFELGDLVSVHGTNRSGGPSNNRLLPQQVSRVDTSKYAIGRVHKREPEVVTSVLVVIRSTVMFGR